MPMLYGEGERAFMRLQHEIMRSSDDHTIFAWRKPGSLFPDGNLLASSPFDFRLSAGVVQTKKQSEITFSVTNKGIQLRLPLMPTDQPGIFLGPLDCRDSWADASDELLAIRLQSVSESGAYFRKVDSGRKDVIGVLDPIKATKVTNLKSESIYVAPEHEEEPTSSHGYNNFQIKLFGVSRGVNLSEIYPDNLLDSHG